MERTRFDALARSMAEGRSRRSVLKLLAGGIAAGVVGTRVATEAVAQDLCASAGGSCRVLGCCAGSTCDVDSGVCIPDDATCIAPGEACVMEVNATPCCGEYSCFEAVCDNARGCFTYGACTADTDCCDGFYCRPDLGVCSEIPAGTADEMPNLGTGAGATGGGSWVAGAAALGAAAAVAAVVVRKGEGSVE